MKHLAEIFQAPISGEWGDESKNNDGVKVIRTTNFTNTGRLKLEKDIAIREISFSKVDKKKLEYGDSIIEKSGGSPDQPVGRVVFFDIKNDVFLCNNFAAILRPISGYHPKFCFYILYYLYKSKAVLKFQNKTTGIINLKLNDYLNDTQISLPPLEIQKKVADVLDKAQELIDKRKEQIEKLDEFVKSVFLEMFGDPAINEKEWKKESFGSYIEVLTDYHANGSYEVLKKYVELLNQEDYALMVRTTDLESGDFSSNVKFITKNAYEFLGKTKVYGGELIINKIGSAGNVYLMPDLSRPVSLGMNQFMIRLAEGLTNVFAYNLFNIPTGKQLLLNEVRGAVTKTITKDAVRAIIIPVPPLDLQNKFAKIVEKVEQQKSLMQQSLKQMEDNFNIIMEKAFRGELFK